MAKVLKRSKLQSKPSGGHRGDAYPILDVGQDPKGFGQLRPLPIEPRHTEKQFEK